MIKSIIFLFIVLSLNISYANNIGSETGLKVPRYVSLKSNDSNIRIGPSKNYPILIKFVFKNYPIQIIDEYQNWRKIIDFKNNTGWIHKSLIKGERNGIIISQDQKKVYIYNINEGKLIGEINDGSIIHLPKCKKKWCLIKTDNYKGWVKKENIWGVNKDETFDIGFFQFITDYYFRLVNLVDEYIN